ncbi:hypothetical protein ACFSQ7_50095 [Paenibacillus rhizoplanae]
MTPETFVPAAKASRAQAVVMLSRLLKIHWVYELD